MLGVIYLDSREKRCKNKVTFRFTTLVNRCVEKRFRFRVMFIILRISTLLIKTTG